MIATILFSAPAAEALELAASHPAGVKAVPTSTPTHLRFSDAINSQTLGYLTLQESGTGNKRIEIKRSTDLTNASISVSPKEFLSPETRFELRGSESFRSAAGENLEPFRLELETAGI